MNVNAEFPEKLEFLFKPSRYKIAYGGRGGAKSWGFARALLIIGLHRPIRVLCGREIQRSIRDSVHQLLRDQVVLLGLEGHYEVLEHEIRGKNGTLFTFAGFKHNINNIKSAEGFDIVWFAEAQGSAKRTWEVLVPTIRKPGSEIWADFNPDLDSDYVYKHFVLDPPSSATVVKIGWEDNPWFPGVLDEERLELLAKDPDAYQNVWDGFPRKFLDGAVYANELRKTVAENRITKVPYVAGTPVHTFWDLGRSDDTSIWFAQYIGFEFRLIDFYGNRGFPLDHYMQVLQGRGYTYGECWIPHDGQAKTLGTKRTVEEQLRDAGWKVRVVPNISVADGINAARTLFNRCWFDESNCADGLQCLQRYRYDVDDDGNPSRNPMHDQWSHGADAFRYFAVAMKEPRKSTAPKVFIPQYAGNWMG